MTIVELVTGLRALIAGAIEDEETGHEDSDALANLGFLMQHEGDALLDKLIEMARDVSDLPPPAIVEAETLALAGLQTEDERNPR